MWSFLYKYGLGLQTYTTANQWMTGKILTVKVTMKKITHSEEDSATPCYLPAAAFRSFFMSLVLQLCWPWIETKAVQASGGGSSLAIWEWAKEDKIFDTGYTVAFKRQETTF